MTNETIEMNTTTDNNIKTGLVLEGGALRGLYTMGIVDVLIENGIHFDGLIGVSAGAAFGCNYLSRQPGRALRYNQRFSHDWRYCSLRSWLCTGDLFGAEFAYHRLPKELDPFDFQTFKASKTDFYMVCTDVETGQPVYRLAHQDMPVDALCEWIRASASMPLVSRVVEIEGRKLLDGGVSDSIPLRYFQQQGYQRNLVILTQPRDYVKQPTAFMPLMRLSLRHYPNMIAALANRHVMYNAQLRYVAAQEKLGHTLVLAPEEKLPKADAAGLRYRKKAGFRAFRAHKGFCQRLNQRSYCFSNRSFSPLFTDVGRDRKQVLSTAHSLPFVTSYISCSVSRFRHSKGVFCQKHFFGLHF